MKPSCRLLIVWMITLSLPAVIPLLLTGCQPTKPTPPVVTTTGCAAFARITVSSHDAETISLPLLQAIHAHNLAYDRLCGKK